jgi:hypothetical protein
MVVVFLGSSSLRGDEPARKGTQKIDFAREIRPILANHCWACHGPDENTREGGLRLDVRAAATGSLKSGKVAIKPGATDSSALVARIDAKKESHRMPPPESKKPLSDVQKQLLKRWIAEGAEYREHWAFIAPKRPALPAVKDKTWGRNPIDAFILARLEQEGLQPAPEASMETLLRRVSLDLTGLPPTLEDLERFLNDRAANAYEKAVDRLLASPRYAERMALPWLDAARYADTNGYNNDEERFMWPWRDWVINAFQKNMPYDRFIIEQIAGDLLPNPTVQQKIATGFNRNHVLTTEGGIFEDEYRVEYVADRVHTTATVFLGLSMQCARCHDHKYDPITQKEYYQFFAFFNNVNDRVLNYNKGGAAEPFIHVSPAENQAKLASLEKRRVDIVRLLKERTTAMDEAIAAWEKDLTAEAKVKLAKSGAILHFPLNEGKGNQVADAVLPARKGTMTGKAIWGEEKFGKALEFNGMVHADLGPLASFDSGDPFSISAWVYPTTTETGAILTRMDDGNAYRGWDLVLEAGKVGSHLIHHWPDDGLKVLTKQPITLKGWHHVLMTYDGSRKAAGIKIHVDGQVQAVDVINDKLHGTIQTDKSLHVGKRDQSLNFKGKISDVQCFGGALDAEDAARLAQRQPIGNITRILDVAPEQRSAAQKAELRRYYLEVIDAEARQRKTELAELDRQKKELEKASVPVMVMLELMPRRQSYLLKRGQYDQPGDKVSAGVPALLPPLPKNAPANRLGLAQWLVHPAHPLTARVAVNRWWAMYFGAGLVETVEDFGLQGEFPSHPELLDWLATEFISPRPTVGEGPGARGWNVKALQKLIVTSATYRQSSRVTKELLERDPKNRLLARAPRLRLPAETIRDNALAISGLLKDKIGGPSVKPYQPAGLWEDVSVNRGYKYAADKGDGLYRRSMYTFWRRTCPPPSMMLFDAPDRETCFIRRARTNTPLHALVLMNDPTYLEAARKLAERVMHQEATPEARLTLAYRLILARGPSGAEQKIMRGMMDEALARFQADPAAAAKLLAVGEAARDGKLNEAELAAWTTMMNLLLNLDETITKG